MNINIHGHGQGGADRADQNQGGDRHNSNPLQTMRQLEHAREAVLQRMDCRYLAEIERQLAFIRTQVPNGGGPHHSRPGSGPQGLGLGQLARPEMARQAHTRLQAATPRPVTVATQRHTHEPIEQIEPAIQQAEIANAVPHGLPGPATFAGAREVAGDLIDLTSIADGEEREPRPSYVNGPPPETSGEVQNQVKTQPPAEVTTPEIPAGTSILSDQIQPPPVKKELVTHTEYSTLVTNPDGDGYVELRCQVCKGNASRQHNALGQLKFFNGANGFLSHYRICHPSKIVAGESLSLLGIVRKFTHRILTEDEVKDMLARKVGAYAVGHYLAAASEENSKIRGPRENGKRKIASTGKSGVKQGGQSKSIPRKRLVGPAYEDDDDDEDYDLPTKKHTRRL